MKVEIQYPVDSECWNEDAINTYAEQINATESRLSANPDIIVMPGKIACRSCVKNIHGNGILCSAQLTETQFAVVGERPPRLEDAFGSLYESVPGYKLAKPGSGRMAEGYVPPVAETAQTVTNDPTPARSRRRLRNLLNR